MLGIPVELENRTQTGVEGLLKWGAVESFFASSEGVNVPTVVIPFAWAIVRLLVDIPSALMGSSDLAGIPDASRKYPEVEPPNPSRFASTLRRLGKACLQNVNAQSGLDLDACLRCVVMRQELAIYVQQLLVRFK